MSPFIKLLCFADFFFAILFDCYGTCKNAMGTYHIASTLFSTLYIFFFFEILCDNPLLVVVFLLIVKLITPRLKKIIVAAVLVCASQLHNTSTSLLLCFCKFFFFHFGPFFFLTCTFKRVCYTNLNRLILTEKRNKENNKNNKQLEKKLTNCRSSYHESVYFTLIKSRLHQSVYYLYIQLKEKYNKSIVFVQEFTTCFPSAIYFLITGILCR